MVLQDGFIGWLAGVGTTAPCTCSANEGKCGSFSAACGRAWERAALECGGKRSATPLFGKGTSAARPRPVIVAHTSNTRSPVCVVSRPQNSLTPRPKDPKVGHGYLWVLGSWREMNVNRPPPRYARCRPQTKRCRASLAPAPQRSCWRRRPCISRLTRRQECRRSQGGGWVATQGGGRRSAPLPWAMMLRPFRPVVRCGRTWGSAALECGGKRSATPLFGKGTSAARPRRTLRRTHVQHPFSGLCCKPSTKSPHAKTQRPQG